MTIDGLASGISLKPGELKIEFYGTEGPAAAAAF